MGSGLAWSVAMRTTAVGDVLAGQKAKARGPRWLRVLRWGRRYPTGAVGLIFVCIVVIVAVFGQAMAPHSFTATDAANKWGPPSSQNWFGSDNFGRDVWSRILVGARGSLTVGIFATLLGTTIGALFGLFSGYKGGMLDSLLQRILDIWMPIPNLIFALLWVIIFGASLPILIVAIALPMIPSVSRVVRGVTLSVKENAYIDAARVIGCSDKRIMLRHIAPNVMAAYMILFSGHVGGAILAEASLSFLGLGIPPPMATWGKDLRKAMDGLQLNPWAGIGPGVALSLAVYGFNLLGDAMRDAFDPRLRR